MSSAFFDTNVLVYLLADDPKAERSSSLMADGGVISVQVLNEFALVARRRHALDWDDLVSILDGFRDNFVVRPLTVETQARAVEIARRYQYRIYDANILAAAEEAGCETVYSEDLQHGQIVGGIRIMNPFHDA